MARRDLNPRTHELPAQNMDAGAIPAFGLVTVSGATDEGLLQVVAPSEDGQATGVLVNNFHAIPANSFGGVSQDWPLYAAYDTADGTPAAGETWGTKRDSFKLHKGLPGFTVLGGADADLGRVLVTNAPPGLWGRLTSAGGPVVSFVQSEDLGGGYADIVNGVQGMARESNGFDMLEVNTIARMFRNGAPATAAILYGFESCCGAGSPIDDHGSDHGSDTGSDDHGSDHGSSGSDTGSEETGSGIDTIPVFCCPNPVPIDLFMTFTSSGGSGSDSGSGTGCFNGITLSLAYDGLGIHFVSFPTPDPGDYYEWGPASLPGCTNGDQANNWRLRCTRAGGFFLVNDTNICFNIGGGASTTVDCAANPINFEAVFGPFTGFNSPPPFDTRPDCCQCDGSTVTIYVTA